MHKCVNCGAAGEKLPVCNNLTPAPGCMNHMCCGCKKHSSNCNPCRETVKTAVELKKQKKKQQQEQKQKQKQQQQQVEFVRVGSIECPM